jgi:hypothetical protein
MDCNSLKNTKKKDARESIEKGCINSLRFKCLIVFRCPKRIVFRPFKGVEVKPEPTPKNYQEREGVMLWDIQIKPKAVQNVRVKFSVKHPKENPPLGL